MGLFKLFGKVGLLILVFNSTQVLSQCGDELKLKLKLIQEKLRDYHLLGNEISGDRINETMEIVLDQIDPDKLIFTEKEASELHKQSMVNSNASDVCSSYSMLKSRYLSALNRMNGYVDKYCETALNFNSTSAENLSFKYEKRAATESLLAERWKKEIKFYTGIKIYNSLDSSILHSSEPIIIEADLEENSRIYIKESLKCDVSRLIENESELDKELTEIWLNAYCLTWDPHSNYFSMSDEEEFTMNLSEEILSFGMWLKDEENKGIVIERVIPGGAAWKTNRVNEGDVLMSLYLDNVDLLKDPCVSSGEIMEKINIAEEKKITFIVKKQNGISSKIELWNELISNEENLIHSYLLKGEKKFGYINLPSFYTDFNSYHNPGCANDVAKQILYLKREGIEGLILDLRNNGGGSLDEALALAGIFIDEGPMCIIGSKDDEPYLLKDPNRGTIYDGPLLVLINELSASASELTANILRDYNRALVVGAPSYGKATSQIVLPIELKESDSPMMMNKYDKGFVKLTTSVIYNLKNESYQAKGIQPDIELPEVYRSFIKVENEEKYFINPPGIEKEVNYTMKPSFPLQELKTSSSVRKSNSVVFQKEIPDALSKVDRAYNQNLTSLNFESIKKAMIEIDESGGAMRETLYKQNGNYTSDNHRSEKALLEFDDLKRSLNETALKKINGDLFIHESYNVLIDYLNNKQ